MRSALIKQHDVEYTDVCVLGDRYTKTEFLKTTNYNHWFGNPTPARSVTWKSVKQMRLT
jgi:hypothetical protein